MRVVYVPYAWLGNGSYLQPNVGNNTREEVVLHNCFKSSNLHNVSVTEGRSTTHLT